jgi:hypothetical protein
MVHKRFSRCVGGNDIIHRGVSRLEGSCESHVIVAAAGVEGVGSVGQLIKIAMLRVKNALPFLEC